MIWSEQVPLVKVLAKDNSVVDSSLVKKETSSKSSGKKTVAVKKEDSDAGSAKMNSDSVAESDSEENTSAFPDTSINLLTIGSDRTRNLT